MLIMLRKFGDFSVQLKLHKDCQCYAFDCFWCRTKQHAVFQGIALYLHVMRIIFLWGVALLNFYDLKDTGKFRVILPNCSNYANPELVRILISAL